MDLNKFNERNSKLSPLIFIIMIKHISLFLILSLFGLCLQAQTIKTGVLVVGNTPAGVAAAIQSARSGAKTTYLTQSLSVNPVFAEEDLQYLWNIRNHYFLKERKKSKVTDSIIATKINLLKATDLIKNIADTVKNLNLNHNNVIDEITKDGKGWEVRLKGGQKIKTDVIVDATDKLSLASLLRIDMKKAVSIPVKNENPFDSKLIRSGMATGYLELANNERSIASIPPSALIPAGFENFIVVPKQIGQVKPERMGLGQAAGTIAAYCAFFKTTTKTINIRVVQGELLAFDAVLIPYSDIDQKDPNFKAFQQLGLSGLMKSTMVKDGNINKIKFDTAGTLTSEELRAPMKEFYTRSQIWFADNKADTLTIGDAISLFMFTATRGEELKKEIEEGWKVSFKFNSKFDLKRNISRKEFGILADRYLQPFNVRVDLAGNLMR
ncbi:MAG: hypothetical protein B7X86_04290 [Sphingobacteriales bacterium 17-39-43]|nr:MAG: hypothetical protein B7Y24_05115 [Sphingobacteriales bacterium 16-39-50]OZA25917.1 MAG: hypothetical protein B7X86_04290 [Sphingobacteriales bacterium 17-39-43]